MSQVDAITQPAGDFEPLMRQFNAALEQVDGEKRLHELLDALPAGVYITDAAGRITFYNEAAVALWGRRPQLNSDRWCGSWRVPPVEHQRVALGVLEEGHVAHRRLTDLALELDACRLERGARIGDVGDT